MVTLIQEEFLDYERRVKIGIKTGIINDKNITCVAVLQCCS